MPLISVYNELKEKVGELELNETVFNAPVKKHLFHEVVRMQMARQRKGTASTKGRDEVRGGGRKPWRQKGTGRARAGTRRSPLWKGGGVIFGPKPRAFSFAVPKKVRRAALRAALTLRLQEEQLLVVENLHFEQTKTKDMVEFIKRFDVDKVLIVIQERNDAVERSARNLQNIQVLREAGLNVYDILRYDTLLITKPAIQQIESRLQS